MQDGPSYREKGVGEAMFNFGALATVLVVAVLLTISGIKILKEYERAVIFRLGRLVKARGPGIIYVIPWTSARDSVCN